MSVSNNGEALACRGLRTGYGEVEVVRGVDLSLAGGELLALLGPNGAGKSTLLLALAGYLPSTSGEVRLYGQPCHDPPHRRARAGLMFLGEDRHVFPSLTVAQSLRLVRGATGEAVRMFPRLEGLMRRRAGLLSGGEQKMLMLGQALAGGPRVLLVDELSLGLAPLVRDELLAILREIADSGTAVLVVEQSVRAVLGVADRAVLLRRGEVIDERPAKAWTGDLDRLAELYLS